MLRAFKLLLVVPVLMAGVPRAKAFSFGGPIANGTDAYQIAEIAYGLGGDNNAPKNIGEEYRWQIPIRTYAFDQTFLDYFGTDGVRAVEDAFGILNATFSTSVDSWNIDQFPLDSSRYNYLAQALNIFDVKSATLALMVENLGLAQAERWVWALRQRVPVQNAQCPTMDYTVIIRNFDPVTFEPSSYVNGTLYTYQIQEDCSTTPQPAADAVELAVDAEAASPTSVASQLLTLGQFYTGITRDDAAGLRYLLSSNNVNFEPGPAGSQLVSGTVVGGGVTNSQDIQFLTTQNLGALLAQATTNTAAQLQTLYPGLIITATLTNFVREVTTNVVAVFTNYPTAPVGTAATLSVNVVVTTNFAYRYQHTFGNILTNTIYPFTWIARQTISVTNSPTAPVGTTNLVTNVSPSKLKPTLTNLISGDFLILPTNVCGYHVLDSIANLILVTNVLISIDSTNTGAIGTNVTATNVGSQSFTVQEISYFTNHLLAVNPVDCGGGGGGTNSASLRGGAGRMQFVKVEYDSLIGRTLLPTNFLFQLNAIANGVKVIETWQRTVVTPDILFTAADLTGAQNQFNGTLVNRTAPTFTADPAPPGGALAGPGTISGTMQITFDKTGPNFANSGPTTILGEQKGTNVNWGYFDGSTNLPIVFPSGRSISNLQYQILHPNP